MAEATASDESDAVAKQEDEQIGIFQILDKLKEAVDALLNTSSSMVHPTLEVRTKQTKPHHCTQCSKSFAQKSKLKIHMKIHTGVKPFSCSQCSKSFARLDKLHGHLRIHSGEKPYSCSQCSKSFTQPHGLQGHLRIHSKPYSCENCTKSFARSDQLRHHVRSGVCSKSAELIGHMNIRLIPMMYSNYLAAF